jgi:hypothetical protein
MSGALAVFCTFGGKCKEKAMNNTENEELYLLGHNAM